ncbi:MAG: diadenosine tetraphosphate hydrolase [Pseudolysinimonas sp.]
MTDWRTDRIGAAIRGENPTVMFELTSGWAVIGDAQFLPGYCVMLSRNIEATKLADLSRSERVQFLADTDLLSTAVGHACAELDSAFRRTNIDILGNADPFVHAHVFPRYDWEPAELVWRPVWLYPIENWGDPVTALGRQHDELRSAITAHLVRLASEAGAICG